MRFRCVEFILELDTPNEPLLTDQVLCFPFFLLHKFLELDTPNEPLLTDQVGRNRLSGRHHLTGVIHPEKAPSPQSRDWSLGNDAYDPDYSQNYTPHESRGDAG